MNCCAVDTSNVHPKLGTKVQYLNIRRNNSEAFGLGRNVSSQATASANEAVRIHEFQLCRAFDDDNRTTIEFQLDQTGLELYLPR